MFSFPATLSKLFFLFHFQMFSVASRRIIVYASDRCTSAKCSSLVELALHLLGAVKICLAKWREDVNMF